MKAHFEAAGAILASLFIGFLISEMIEEQQNQIARIRAMREKMASQNGFETDAQKLAEDWQKIGSDVQRAIDRKRSQLNLAV